jgi:serine/threonine protein kinase
MELVRGIAITEHCDQNNLPTEIRLKLFIQVCQAVQHAHQKGIIHRDLNPRTFWSPSMMAGRCRR